MKLYLPLIVVIFMIITSQECVASDWSDFPLPSLKITSLESTPEGIVAGEFDDRLWLNPYNGVYLTQNSGQTWNKIGLDGRGIKHLKFANGKIYASSFYTIGTTKGLFVSSYPYATWEKLGPNIEPTEIDICGDNIYVGTKLNGLIVSRDEGLTWSQSLGSGWGDPEILDVHCHLDSVFVATITNFYVSLNAGNNWITPPMFSGVSIYSIQGNEINTIATGVGYEGLIISSDNGVTWQKIPLLGFSRSRKLLLQGQYIFLSNPVNLLSSINRGDSWTNELLDVVNTSDVNDLVIQELNGYKIIALNSSGKAFVKELFGTSYSPLLSTPFNISGETELVENINSYFDHKYPLLGYLHFLEPIKDNSTTLIFNGTIKPEPEIYYSSHSGYDFDMEYGEDVLAAADGEASYYYCKDCGNTIKISHGFGFQTIYMHLQNSAVTQGNNVVWVNEGDKIGKVGLTGRTTGPHLHFEVTVDSDKDGSYNDEFPNGRTDPFGWDYLRFLDPWSAFVWTDILGTHKGSVSKYLWKPFANIKKTAPLQNNNVINLGNKTVEILNDGGKKFLQIVLETASKPHDNDKPTLSDYIRETSFVLNIIDQLGNPHLSEVTAKVDILLQPENISSYLPNTIKLYRWSEDLKQWVELVSSFNPLNNVLSATIDHLSYFAAFGEISETQSVITEINTEPETTDGFAQTPVSVTFSTNGVLTLYSLDGGDTWEEYSAPLLFDTNGTYEILYKSRDAENNWEETQSFNLKVGIISYFNTIRVVGATFETSANYSSP